VIRRLFFGTLGVALTLTGLANFGYCLSAEPGFGPKSTDMAMAYILAGIALGACGIWLVRLSVRREDPR